MSFLELRDIWFGYAKGMPVLKGISTDVGKGEVLALLGPSGCGKTTLLKVIAGFVKPDRDSIFLEGKGITNVPPNKRNMGVVFQSYALFPHMTVEQNVAYGLSVRGYPRGSISEKVKSVLELVGLGELKKRHPSELSGGQQQRVALARALAIEPSIMLMDEPMSNVDPKFRSKLRSEIRRLLKSLNITTIYVTHDQEDAMEIADEIAIMRDGMIEQRGAPEDLFANPKTSFIAEFLGLENVFTIEAIERREGLMEVRVGRAAICANPEKYNSGKAKVGINPCKVLLSKEGLPDHIHISGVVRSKIFKGATVKYVVETELGEIASLTMNTGEACEIGERVVLNYRPSDVVFLED